MGDIYTNPPQSRNEAILRATIDGTEYTAPPQSRIEDLLLELKEAIEQGGGAGGMSKDTYDPDDVVADAGGIAAYVDDEITDLHLGTASTKNSTSVVTDSSDLVESGAVYDAIGANVGFVTTGKNKLWFTLEGLKSTNTVGTWSGNTYSYKGVTFTVNDDGTITANGTVNTSGHANFEIAIPSDLYGDLKYNGARDGTTNKYDTFMWDYQTNARCKQWDGVTDSLSGYTDLEKVKVIQGHNTRLICRIFNGFTANNVKFYPMITNATVTDNSYEPHHASVEESLEQKCDNSVIGTVEDGANPTKAYAVNEFMVRDGAFCQVTAPVTTSSTWTEGSNYTKKSIAEVLQSLMS